MQPNDRVIAGALFDFAAYLTTRKTVIPVGMYADASPLVQLLRDFASERDLSLDDADVKGWNIPVPPLVPATPEVPRADA